MYQNFRTVLIAFLCCLIPKAQGETIFNPAVYAFSNYLTSTADSEAPISYKLIDIPTFSAAQIDPLETGEYQTVCISPGNCAVFAFLYGGEYGVIITDREEVINRLKKERLHTMPYIAYVKTDSDSLNRFMGRSKYSYRLGDSADVDKGILECGFAAAGCLLTIFSATTIIGGFGAGLACTGAAIPCTYAAKTLKKYVEDREAGKIRPAGGGNPSAGIPTGPIISEPTIPDGTVTVGPIIPTSPPFHGGGGTGCTVGCHAAVR